MTAIGVNPVEWLQALGFVRGVILLYVALFAVCVVDGRRDLKARNAMNRESARREQWRREGIAHGVGKR